MPDYIGQLAISISESGQNVENGDSAVGQGKTVLPWLRNTWNPHWRQLNF